LDPVTAFYLERHRVFAGLPTGFTTIVSNINQKDCSMTTLRESHDGPVTALDLMRNGSILLSGGFDGAMHIYDLSAMKRVAKFINKPSSTISFYFLSLIL
jgi:WD40 repeat protein